MSNPSNPDQRPVVNEYLDNGTLLATGWRRALLDGILLGQACNSCEHVTAAPKAACAQCGSRSLTIRQLPTVGTVYAETTIAVPPEAFDAPYQVAIISLNVTAERTGNIIAMIDGEVGIGDTVELQGVETSDSNPGPVFAPSE